MRRWEVGAQITCRPRPYLKKLLFRGRSPLRSGFLLFARSNVVAKANATLPNVGLNGAAVTA